MTGEKIALRTRRTSRIDKEIRDIIESKTSDDNAYSQSKDEIRIRTYVR